MIALRHITSITWKMLWMAIGIVAGLIADRTKIMVTMSTLAAATLA